MLLNTLKSKDTLRWIEQQPFGEISIMQMIKDGKNTTEVSSEFNSQLKAIIINL
jgi:hypothetical protein